jgi:hypothetical protein
MTSKAKIDLRPVTLDLYLYAGDGATIKLNCKQTDEEGDPINMSGAVKAQVRLNRLDADPPILEITGDMTNALTGIVLIVFTKVQTRLLANHSSATDGLFVGVWDLEWTPTGADPRTLFQGRVECGWDVSR